MKRRHDGVLGRHKLIGDGAWRVGSKSLDGFWICDGPEVLAAGLLPDADGARVVRAWVPHLAETLGPWVVQNCGRLAGYARRRCHVLLTCDWQFQNLRDGSVRAECRRLSIVTAQALVPDLRRIAYTIYAHEDSVADTLRLGAPNLPETRGCFPETPQSLERSCLESLENARRWLARPSTSDKSWTRQSSMISPT